MSSNNNDSNPGMPVLFQMTMSDAEQYSASSSTLENKNAVKKKKTTRVTGTTASARSKVGKKPKTAKVTVKTVAAIDVISRVKTRKASTTPVNEEKENESVASTTKDNETSSSTNASTKFAVPIKTPVLVNKHVEVKESDEAEAVKPKPVPKRVAKLIGHINDNDILAKVRCDNKKKHTASTSTPSGLRRRPLKPPHDVSMISNQDIE